MVVSIVAIGVAAWVFINGLLNGTAPGPGASIVQRFTLLITLATASVLLITVAAVIILFVDQARIIRQVNHRLEQIELLVRSSVRNRA
jgi:hypothetical protein